MAQWLGQYSGLTHATRVEDVEDSLRTAVAAMNAAASGPDFAEKTKAARRLAGRLLAARGKWMKARVATMEELQLGGLDADRAGEIAALELKAASMLAGGVDAILREFAAPAASSG